MEIEMGAGIQTAQASTPRVCPLCHGSKVAERQTVMGPREVQCPKCSGSGVLLDDLWACFSCGAELLRQVGSCTRCGSSQIIPERQVVEQMGVDWRKHLSTSVVPSTPTGPPRQIDRRPMAAGERKALMAAVEEQRCPPQVMQDSLLRLLNQVGWFDELAEAEYDYRLHLQTDHLKDGSNPQTCPVCQDMQQRCDALRGRLGGK